MCSKQAIVIFSGGRMHELSWFATLAGLHNRFRILCSHSAADNENNSLLVDGDSRNLPDKQNIFKHVKKIKNKAVYQR